MTNLRMSQDVIERLERDLEKAIARAMERQKSLPVDPDQMTVHLMAKAAVAVFESAANQACNP